MPKTILLTGVTGFIAKRIALDLLNDGHSVRGSLRKAARADEVRDALRARLTDPAALDRLSFVELTLDTDDGWTAAMDGIDVLMHTASPFPMEQPKNPEDIVRPAVDGTMRALRAAHAAGVNRVILTSSMVSVMYNDAAETRPVTEADWSTPDHPTLSPYGLSKTKAEMAAWDFVKTHPEMTLVTVNPGLVVGTPVDTHTGTSLALVERLMAGKDPMLPDITFPMVDIEDISRLHVMAVENTDMDNTRNLGSAGMMTMVEMGQMLAAEYPARKIATKKAPALLLRVLALFDGALKGILPQLGVKYRADTSATIARTGIEFVDMETALKRSAAFVAAKG